MRTLVFALSFFLFSLSQAQTWHPAGPESTDFSGLKQLIAVSQSEIAGLREEAGLIFSADMGKTWSDLTLPDSLPVPDCFTSSGRKLYVGRSGREVWEWDLDQKTARRIFDLEGRSLGAMAVFQGRLIIGSFSSPDHPEAITAIELSTLEVVPQAETPGPKEAIYALHVYGPNQSVLYAGGRKGVWEDEGGGTRWTNSFLRDQQPYKKGEIWWIDSDLTQLYAAADGGLLKGYVADGAWESVVEEGDWTGLEPDDLQYYHKRALAEGPVDRVLVRESFVVAQTSDVLRITWDKGATWTDFLLPMGPGTLFKAGKAGFFLTTEGKLYQTPDLLVALKKWREEFLRKK